MRKKRKRHSAAFKAKVALEAAKGDKTIAQLATAYQVAPAQISTWKRKLKQGLPQLFESKANQNVDYEKLSASLYEEIGRLKWSLTG